MSDLLLELFSEEIPARMQVEACVKLVELLSDNFRKLNLPFDEWKTFVTPRRLTIYLAHLPALLPKMTMQAKGPKIGAPQNVIDAFLKAKNLTMDQLVQKDGCYCGPVIESGGQPTAELLKPMIEKILKTFPWPKSMRWGSGDATWVRPLHSILCLFDGKVVPVEFAGVKAGNTTRGHRFLNSGDITIPSAADYESALEKAHVIADRDKRKAEILKQASAIAAAKNLSIRKDDALLEEVTGLVEWPVVLVGTIDAKFMDLPPEILTTVMRSHQKYFALLDSKGALSPHFLIAANMMTQDGGKAIVAGNERVLRARFSDARFFWDQDRKKPLSEWARGLATVTYHAKLGSIADKVTRIAKLADTLAASIPNADKKLVQQAAALSKADLVTGMVGEFAELQGIMGRYYALQQKEDAAVADAIRDHYKPQGPGDSVPTAPVSICIALADKLDTLIAMFAIGEKPTSSKDPFALRRAALGVIRIVLENNIRLPLKALFALAPMHEIALHRAQDTLVKKTEADLHDPARIGKYLTVNETACSDIPEGATAELIKSLFDFFIDRLKVQLKDSGIRHDVINAVIHDGDDDLWRVKVRAKALQEFLATEDGANLLAAYKRAVNILAIEEKKDKTRYNQHVPFNEFTLAEEQTLKQALSQTADGVLPLLEKENFTGALSAFSKLRAPVDTFFDKVLVNDKDEATRKKRLCLLSELKQAFDRIANFSLIEG